MIAEREGAEVVVICAQVEAELAELADDDRAEFLESLGLERSGLERLIERAYDLLGLITFFTAGPKEARAWTIRRGFAAPRAAREIHSDIERGFIRAEVISYADYDDARLRGRRQGRGPAARGGQGLRGAGRRRRPLPLQRLTADRRPSSSPSTERTRS